MNFSMTVMRKTLKWGAISVGLLVVLGLALGTTGLGGGPEKSVATPRATPKPTPQATARVASGPQPPVVALAQGAPRYTLAAMEQRAEAEIARELSASTTAKGVKLEPGTMDPELDLYGHPRGRLLGVASFRITHPKTGVRADVVVHIRGSYDLRGKGDFVWATTRVATLPVSARG